MKRKFISILLIFFSYLCFSLDKKDFTLCYNNKFLISLEDILPPNFIKELKPGQIKQINNGKDEPPIIDYCLENLIIQTSNNSKITDILVSSNDYPICGGLRIGDALENVLKRYEGLEPDTQNSNEDYYILMYTYKVPVTERWKEPKYYLIVRFRNEVVYDIEMIYFDW